jgi:hypothetical protein
MFKITTDKEIINAIKQVEELKKVHAILKIKLAIKEGVSQVCKDYVLTSAECRELNIQRGSIISCILAINKELN